MKYMVKSGTHHHDGKVYVAGNVVELDEAVADSFPDRFERVIGKPGRPAKDEKKPEGDSDQE
jgi:hypothetical protein